MEDNRLSLFFEASDLSESSLDDIHRYFQIRRRSGGGECKVQREGGSSYRVTFISQQARDRVLKNMDHAVTASKGQEIRLSLSDSPTSPQDCAEDHQTEKVVELSRYLQLFLSESKKASAHLEASLSSVSSSFQMHTEAEQVTVARRGSSSEKWNAAVEDIFNQLKQLYKVHFEADQDLVAHLKDNSCLFNENLKLYNDEAGFVVVVGETESVDKILKHTRILRDQQQVQTEVSVSEKQMALIKEPLEQKRSSSFPTLLIAQKTADLVLLKGSDVDVKAAEDALSSLKSQIKEKVVTLQVSLTTFLDSSGAIQHFQERFQQGLRSPVMLQTSGPDVILTSLHDGPLQEAATTLQRDLCLETIPVEHCSRLNQLIEDLSRAVQQVNQAAVKVAVHYTHESHVQLVGFTPEVDKLKTIVLDFKRGQEDHHHCFNLQKPEMVEHFDEILSLVGINLGTVTANPSCSPRPCVHLTGPRRDVEDIKRSLQSSLPRVQMQEVPLVGPGIHEFYQTRGPELLSSIKDSHQVRVLPVVEENQSLSDAHHYESLSSLQASPSPQSVGVRVVVGGLEEQQADAFLVPMTGADLRSTRVGSCLLSRAGPELQTVFSTMKAKRALAPGDVLEVPAPPTLSCSTLFFIQCLPRSLKNDQSEMTLRSGLARALAQCVHQRCSSVAMPVMGPGAALSVPLKSAVSILTDEMVRCLSGSRGDLHTLHVCVMPDCEEIFQTVTRSLSVKMVDATGRAVFHSLTSDLDEVTATVDGIQLNIVFGDITNEKTDAVVNTTDFKDLKSRVCKDILAKAGAPIQTQLAKAKVQRGEIFITPAGGFPCDLLLHVCGHRDPALIRSLARDIVLKCEDKRCQSVAIPAICAGKGNLDPAVVATSILQGVKEGVHQAPLRHLHTIRMVLLKINVFLAFKAAAQQMFPVYDNVSAGQTLVAEASGGRRPSQSPAPPVTPRPSALLVLGLSSDAVSGACDALHRTYENQCSTVSISGADRKILTDELLDLEERVCLLPGGAGDLWRVTGLRHRVEELQKVLMDALRRKEMENTQNQVFTKVSWCIMGDCGVWQKLPREANFQLETGDVTRGVVDARGRRWSVSLPQMMARARDSDHVTDLKRLENQPDFALPITWDNLLPDEPPKLVTLDPTSSEYQDVKMDFNRSAAQSVLKIQRVQNISLLKMFEVRKAELESRNDVSVGAREMLLYHGSSEASCSAIINTNFNRSLAGQNATCFGIGTYFAVDARYSANKTYASPAADGTQQMFVARVLTGHHTRGQRNMKVPPVRVPPDLRYDSLVDDEHKPSMFVVFHDCQAYPEYLITFQ